MSSENIPNHNPSISRFSSVPCSLFLVGKASTPITFPNAIHLQSYYGEDRVGGIDFAMPLSRASAAVDKEYVKTNTGDLVSRKAHVHGSQNLYLKGKVSYVLGLALSVPPSVPSAFRGCFLCPRKLPHCTTAVLLSSVLLCTHYQVCRSRKSSESDVDDFVLQHRNSNREVWSIDILVVCACPLPGPVVYHQSSSTVVLTYINSVILVVSLLRSALEQRPHTSYMEYQLFRPAGRRFIGLLVL